MKRILTLLSLSALCALLVGIQSCKDDDDPKQTDVERVTALLVGDAWNIQSVMVDAVNYTEDFTGLSISFTESTITSTEGKALFPASASWAFLSDAAEVLVIDGTEMAISSISSNELVLEFEVSESIFGRADAVGGTNQLTFTR